MAAYAQTPSALTWLHVNHLINGLHKQISCKNCLYAVNSYFMIAVRYELNIHIYYSIMHVASHVYLMLHVATYDILFYYLGKEIDKIMPDSYRDNARDNEYV